MTSKKNAAYDEFLKENLPQVPNFVEANRPNFDPGFTLAPKGVAKQTHEKDLIEVYFNNDVRHLEADMHARPEHWTAEQKAIIDAMKAKKDLPPGTTRNDLNEIVMRYMDKAELRAKREKVIQTVQKATGPRDEDPTVQRAIEQHEQGTFEDQASIPKAIKII